MSVIVIPGWPHLFHTLLLPLLAVFPPVFLRIFVTTALNFLLLWLIIEQTQASSLPQPIVPSVIEQLIEHGVEFVDQGVVAEGMRML